MRKQKKWSLQELSTLTGCPLSISHPAEIDGVKDIHQASLNQVTFLENPRYLSGLEKTNAGLICIHKDAPLLPGKNYLLCDHPSKTFQTIVEAFFDKSYTEPSFIGIHAKACIDPSAVIGEGTSIGAYAVIERDVVIGKNCHIHAHVTILPGTTLGDNCLIYPHVTLRERCTIGNRVILQPGAVIGSCGFGYTSDTGKHEKINHYGTVILEDDVEIGANTTVDRGRFDATRILSGTKIDNLCQIAHNVTIGQHNLIVSQAGIAGSTETGSYVVIGGQVGIIGHLKIPSKTMIAAQSGLSKSPKQGGLYNGSPALALSEYNKIEVLKRKLPELFERVKKLEATHRDHLLHQA